MKRDDTINGQTASMRSYTTMRSGYSEVLKVSLRRQLNAVKRARFPWMYDVSKAVVQESIIDLGTAFRAFFEKRGRYPRFKRKDDRINFCAANEAGTFRADRERIKLPVIGWEKNARGCALLRAA